MNTERDILFPDGLSDEAAAALSAFLYDLAAACESRYLAQLRRHRQGQLALDDSAPPWLSPPTKSR